VPEVTPHEAGEGEYQVEADYGSVKLPVLLVYRAGAGDEEAGSPLLRAVDWGTASFIISDHVGTWVDLEPVG